jgi:hypothetical protein
LTAGFVDVAAVEMATGASRAAISKCPLRSPNW